MLDNDLHFFHNEQTIRLALRWVNLAYLISHKANRKRDCSLDDLSLDAYSFFHELTIRENWNQAVFYEHADQYLERVQQLITRWQRLGWVEDKDQIDTEELLRSIASGLKHLRLSRGIPTPSPFDQGSFPSFRKA